MTEFDYIERASQEGVLDSQGEFTISTDAALAKLSHFQLPRLSAWVSKILQSAVASGAQALRIKQGRKEISFHFVPEDFCADRLLSALSTATLQARGWENHLAIALRSVGLGQGREFSVLGPKLSLSWRPTDSQISREQNQRPHYKGVLIALRYKDQSSRRSEAAEELAEACFYGQALPIPLIFDGRRLDTLAASKPSEEPYVKTLPLAIGCAGPLTELEGLLDFKPPQGVGRGSKLPRLSDKLLDSRPLLLDLGPEDRKTTRLLVRLLYHYGRFGWEPASTASYAHWIKDGVIVHSQPLIFKEPISVELFLCGDDLETDLSGFAIRDGQHTQALLRKAQAGSLWLLEKLAPILAPMEKRRRKLAGAKILLFTGAAIASGGWGMAAAFSTCITWPVLGTRFDLKIKVTQDIQTYLARLRTQLRIYETPSRLP